MHTIVYLDQNYVSNMAKARYGFIKDEDEASFWNSLFNTLTAAVLSDKIICPVSEFHMIEAKYYSELERPIREVLNELSWGLRFYPFQDILELQIEDAATRFLGNKPNEREWWVTVFQSNPYLSIENRREILSKGEHIKTPFRDIQPNQNMKIDFEKEARKLLDEYGKEPLSWIELVSQSKRSFLDGILGKVARESIEKQFQEDSPESKWRAVERKLELLDLWNRLRAIGIDTDSPKVMEFAESKELLAIPFVDIYASIWAGIAWLYCQGRKLGRGDFFDVPILATVLPSSDFVCTDGFMKEVLTNLLHYNDEYKALIYSAIQPDRLDFLELIKGF